MESSDTDDSDDVGVFTKAFMASYEKTAAQQPHTNPGQQNDSDDSGEYARPKRKEKKVHLKRGKRSLSATSHDDISSQKPSPVSKKKRSKIERPQLSEQRMSDNEDLSSGDDVLSSSEEEPGSAEEARLGQRIHEQKQTITEKGGNRLSVRQCKEVDQTEETQPSTLLQDGEEELLDTETSEKSENEDDDTETIPMVRSGASTNEDEFIKLRRELADLPFEDLQKLKQKIGIKAYNQAMFGISKEEPRKRVFKRENKNRPMEMSSKRAVSVFRTVTEVKKKTARDPRFDDLSGEYSEAHFNQAYSFIKDVKQSEKQKLLKQMKKEKNPDKKKQLENLITRMTNQEREDRKKQKELKREQEFRRKERGLVKEGKHAFYLKKGDRKKLELAEKYKDLKQSGKVDNYLAKKRKKTAMKDKKKLPRPGRLESV